MERRKQIKWKNHGHYRFFSRRVERMNMVDKKKSPFVTVWDVYNGKDIVQKGFEKQGDAIEFIRGRIQS